MTPSLTIVVTCANRKSLAVAPELLFRNVPAGPAEKRALDWRERLSCAGEERQLNLLYQGEQWRESLKLADVAKELGFVPRVLVVSAGLGLQPVDATAPAYSATFSLSGVDAVARSLDEAAAWWAQLSQYSAGLDLTKLDDRVLLVLSRSYALPLAEDLAAVGVSNAKSVLVGGASAVPGIVRVPSDASLRNELGGTLSALNQRMAIRFLEFSQGPSGWLSEAHLERWKSWATHSRHQESFDRRRSDDSAIKAWIRHTISHHPFSATRALREYRNQGYASEQTRFARLYREVVIEK